MSRALDQETVASLTSGDPQKAYREISAIFTAEASPGRLEIEILGQLPEGEGGGSGAVVLRDGAAVAIAKKGLVLAFFVARRVLQEGLQQKSGHGGDGEEEEQQEQQAAALAALAAATAVLLLLDPEHLTAANTRKRLLRERMARARAPSRDRAQRPAAALLADELVFVDSLLTSHLHPHPKSPTLWSHRRWLVAQRAAPLRGGTVRGDLADVVMVAAVRHPRNYYAWDHARWLVARYDDDDDDDDDGSDDETETQLVAAVRTWCFQHHTDTSGWSFLLYLLARGKTKTAQRGQLLRDTLAQTEQRAAALRWTGEAVWVFLRTATAALGAGTGGGGGGGGGEEEDERNEQSTARFRATAAALQARVDPASRDHQVLQQAQDWLSRASHG